MLRARLIAGLPADLVGSLTGLTQAHFPVYAKARYADDVSERDIKRLGRKTRKAHNAAALVDSNASRRSINIYSRRGAPVIAVNDGVVKKIGENSKLGRFVVLQDVYGNRFTYAHLGSVSQALPGAEEPRRPAARRDEFRFARAAARGDAAEADRARERRHAAHRRRRPPRARQRRSERPAAAPRGRRAEPSKERLFANPTRPRNRPIAEETGQLLDKAGFEIFRVYFSKALRLEPSQVKLQPLQQGRRACRAARCSAASASSPTGPGSKLAPHLNFSIRPAGRGAPRIDPKPILDGWKLLEATAIYRAAGKNPFVARQRRPGAADVEGGARAPRAGRPERRHLHVRPRRHPHRPDRPPRARDARVPVGLGPATRRSPSLQVRPQLLHRVGQRLRALLGQRGRHRRDQRHADPRPPGQGLDHRGRRSASC